MILYSKELLYKKTWQQGVSSGQELTFIYSYNKSEPAITIVLYSKICRIVFLFVAV